MSGFFHRRPPDHEGKNSMKAVKALAATFMAAGLLTTAAPATASAAAYEHYVACGLSKGARPSHSCRQNGKMGAFFKSLNADVIYSVCVKFPSGKNLCAKSQEAEQGVPAVNEFISKEPGKLRVTWFVKGKSVGTFVLQVTS
jgi:hypothetical protein